MGESGILSQPQSNTSNRQVFNQTISTVRSFKGTYEHSIDSKGRVSFPAKLRKYLNPSNPENFVILKGIQNCLYLYPEDRWMKLEEKLAKISNLTVEGADVIRIFLSNAEDLNLDNQNRLALPSNLTDMVGIGQKVVIVGLMDRLELWNPEAYDKQSTGMSQDEFARKFQELMGGIPL